MPLRVVITGAAGFVGRHLVRFAAAAGAETHGVGRSARGGDGLESYTVLELTDATAVARSLRALEPDRVLHLAAEASVAASWRDPRAVLENNVLSTLSVLEAVRTAAPGARVLVAGSGEVYGRPEQLPVREDAPLRPLNPYAVSKVAVDALAGFYSDAHALGVVRTRAFNHSGPGQSDAYVVSAFARQIAEAEARGERSLELLTGNLEPRRDFTDVRDVVRAYWLLLERADPAAYNVCSGAATAVGDILAGLARHTELEIEPRADPARVRDQDVMEITGSSERLRQATGWEPEIPLDTTLRDTLDWWREELRR